MSKGMMPFFSCIGDDGEEPLEVTTGEAVKGAHDLTSAMYVVTVGPVRLAPTNWLKVGATAMSARPPPPRQPTGTVSRQVMVSGL